MGVGLAAMPSAAHAQYIEVAADFDATLGTEVRTPDDFVAIYDTNLERRVALAANGAKGRIGVYAVDLTTGEEISVLADQRFPLASTSKVAIAATFLAGVDEGRFSLTSEYPLLIRQRSARFSSARAPVKEGNYIPAHEHLGLMISKSCNSCTDALLRVVGGPKAVNEWMQEAGFTEFELTRDIATLVRDDGEYDPVDGIDRRDTASPRTMGRLLAGIHGGRWLSPRSRAVLLQAMEETTTGRRRMNAVLPDSAALAHKTGTLSRTASDIGIFRLPDGRPIVASIYVTGQSANLVDEARNKRRARAQRDARIAEITRALYEGFAARAAREERDPTRNWATEPVLTGEGG